MISKLRQKWFPTPEQEEAATVDQIAKWRKEADIVEKWVESPEFNRLLEFCAGEIEANELSPAMEKNAMFQAGIVKGHRSVLKYLKNRARLTKEMRNA